MSPEFHQQTDRQHRLFCSNKDVVPTIDGKPHADFLGPSTTTQASDFDSPRFVEAQDMLNHVAAVEDQVAFLALARESALGVLPEVREIIELVIEESPWELLDWDIRPETLISQIERIDAENSSTTLPMAVEVTTQLALGRRGVAAPRFGGLRHRRPHTKQVKIVHYEDSWRAISLRAPAATRSSWCSFIISIEWDEESKTVVSEISDLEIQGFST